MNKLKEYIDRKEDKIIRARGELWDMLLRGKNPALLDWKRKEIKQLEDEAKYIDMEVI